MFAAKFRVERRRDLALLMFGKGGFVYTPVLVAEYRIFEGLRGIHRGDVFRGAQLVRNVRGFYLLVFVVLDGDIF